MNETAVDPKKILVVDDDPNVLFLISELLVRDNYQVIQASDGLTALGQIRQMLPALAVLDVMMPGLDGFELCRRIKNDPLTMDIKVIMVTAKTSGRDMAAGLAAAEREQLPHQVRGPRRRLGYLVDILKLFAAGGRALAKKIRVGQYRAQDVVKVVRYPGRKEADGFELL